MPASASPTARPAPASSASLHGAAFGTYTPASYTAWPRAPTPSRSRPTRGNEGSSASYSWTVDTLAPPTPTINSSPPDPSSSTNASFSFSDTEVGVTFRCKLDGGALQRLHFPEELQRSRRGRHSFQVKARDAAGNESAPASYGWTIDSAAPPTPTIDSSPPDPSASASASFSFSDSEAGVSFPCKLDGGGFSTCSSPQSYNGLAEGGHSFQVKARDALGNESASASYSWTVDTLAPPTPTINSSPPDPSSSTNASFSFSDTEAGVTFRCKLDGGALSDCTSPKSYSGLAEGGHSFQVRARDAAGNESAPASYGWTVDSIAPVVTLTAPANGSATANQTPTLSGAAGALSGDSTTITVKVYSGSTPTGTPVRTLTTTRTGTSWSVPVSPALAEGTYTARAEQSDAAGNTGQSSANTFTVDTTAPAITLTSPANSSSTNEVRPTFSGTAGTAVRDLSTVTVKVFTGGTPTGTPVQTLTTTAQGGGAYSVIASSALQAGTYTARAEQSDSVGNTGLSSANTFTITDPVLIGAGDIASCEAGDGDVATAAIINQNPNATVFTLGDHAYSSGTTTEFNNCYDPTWGQFKSRTRPAVGDHEYETPNAAGYYSYFANQLAPYGPAATDPTRGYYSYDIGAWHVSVLNTTCYTSSIGCNRNLMEQWFADDLDAHPTNCTLAIWHQPRFSSGNVHGNNAQMQALWQTAYEHGVDLVLSGHEHDYERFAPMDAVGNAGPRQRHARNRGGQRRLLPLPGSAPCSRTARSTTPTRGACSSCRCMPRATTGSSCPWPVGRSQTRDPRPVTGLLRRLQLGSRRFAHRAPGRRTGRRPP